VKTKQGKRLVKLYTAQINKTHDELREIASDLKGGKLDVEGTSYFTNDLDRVDDLIERLERYQGQINKLVRLESYLE
jgi:hypothetical protein